MPRYAMPSHAAMRKAALNKKTRMDTEMIMESEVWDFHPSKQTQAPSSPMSVASTFYEKMPEITPLPGAWVEVGRGGRPVKSRMYDPPQKPAKKKRVRTRKKNAIEDEERDPAVLALGEEPSSSKCIQMFERTGAVREKQMLKSKDVKFWMRYQHEKQLKVFARDSLVAALADAGLLVGETDETLEKIVAPEPLKLRDDARKTRVANLRRQARHAAAGARCYALEVEEEGAPADPPKAAARGAQMKTSAASDKAARGYPKPRKALASAKQEKVADEVRNLVREAASKIEPTAASNGWLPASMSRRRASKGCIIA